IAAAAVIVPLLVWWLSRGPRPTLTSELLASGTPGEGKILRVRILSNILDMRPMVRFELEATVEGGEGPFDLEVVQSFPRSMAGLFHPGEIVQLRLSPDRSAGAIEWSYRAPET